MIPYLTVNAEIGPVKDLLAVLAHPVNRARAPVILDLRNANGSPLFSKEQLENRPADRGDGGLRLASPNDLESVIAVELAPVTTLLFSARRIMRPATPWWRCTD